MTNKVQILECEFFPINKNGSREVKYTIKFKPMRPEQFHKENKKLMENITKQR